MSHVCGGTAEFVFGIVMRFATLVLFGGVTEECTRDRTNSVSPNVNSARQRASARATKAACFAVCMAVAVLVYRAGNPPRTSVPPEMGPPGTWTWDQIPNFPTSTAYVEIVRFNKTDDPYNPSLYAHVVNPSRRDLVGFDARCQNIEFSTRHTIHAGREVMLEVGFENTMISGGPIDPFRFYGDPVRCEFVRVNFQTAEASLS